MKVCAKCQIELRPLTNGIVALSMTTTGPYEIYSADLWHCPGCGWQGVFGASPQPTARHHDVGFDKLLETAERNRTVIPYWLNRREQNEYTAQEGKHAPRKSVSDAHGSPVYVNSVVQIDPEHDERFGGCLLVVTDVKSWGVVGFVQVPGEDRGAAFYRCPSDAMSEIGPAAWMRQEEPEKESTTDAKAK